MPALGPGCEQNGEIFFSEKGSCHRAVHHQPCPQLVGGDPATRPRGSARRACSGGPAVGRPGVLRPLPGSLLRADGPSLDVKPLVAGAERRAGGVAGYLAKYSIKSSDDNGALDRRLRSLEDLRRKNLNDHLRRLAETAWRLAKRPELAALGVRRFAHALGFRGHWLTKSRAWSTTFAALRAERAAWRNARDEVEDSTTVTLERFWQFQSRGWNDAGESLLAASRERDQATARRERLLELTTIRRGEVAA